MIRIYGRRRHSSPKFLSKSNVKLLTTYCLDTLDAQWKTKYPKLNLKIYISERVGVENMGLCFPGEAPNEYIIFVDPDIEKQEFIKTLFHELIHLIQYCTGALQQSKYTKKGFMWRGEKYNYEQFQEYQLPYEVEAVRKQRELYNLYCKDTMKGTAHGTARRVVRGTKREENS